MAQRIEPVFKTSFRKSYKKRIIPRSNLEKRFFERYELFKIDPSNEILSDHALSGKLKGYRAFSINGDIRVVYYIEKKAAYFIDIGTHNQVYK